MMITQINAFGIISKLICYINYDKNKIKNIQVCWLKDKVTIYFIILQPGINVLNFPAFFKMLNLLNSGFTDRKFNHLNVLFLLQL